MRKLLEAYETLLDLTSIHIDKEQQKLRSRNDSIIPTNFPVGSLVLVSYLSKPTSKLHTRKAGPFLVMSRTANNVVIQNLTSGVEKIMDVSRSTPFIGSGSLSQNQAIAAADFGKTASPVYLDFRDTKRYANHLLFSFSGRMGKKPGNPGRGLGAFSS